MEPRQRQNEKWLPDRDSNPDNQDQNLVSYQLDDPATPVYLSRRPSACNGKREEVGRDG